MQTEIEDQDIKGTSRFFLWVLQVMDSRQTGLGFVSRWGDGVSQSPVNDMVRYELMAIPMYEGGDGELGLHTVDVVLVTLGYKAYPTISMVLVSDCQ